MLDSLLRQAARRGVRAPLVRLVDRLAQAPLALYAVVGLVAFGSVLNNPFLADSYYVLDLVASAPDWRVSLDVVSGHFFRPLFVLLFWVHYQLFGLWPLPYHLTVLAVHIANAYLVFRLAHRFTERRRVALVAGLLFVAFGGHSEPVSWVAAAGDPVMTFALLCSFELFLEWTRQPARWPLALLSCVFFAAALGTKETAIVYPAIVCGYLIIVQRGPWRERLAPATYVAAIAVLSGAYLAFRMTVVGSVTTYDGFSTSQGIFADQSAAFLLRSFVPPGVIATKLWVSFRWMIWLGAGVLVGTALWAARASRHPLFLVAALGASLAPALPLTISLASSESERFVYLPSVFACILSIWWFRQVLRDRRALAAICLAWLAFHLVILEQSNRTWREAATLANTIGDRLAQHASGGSHGDARIFVLNLPDSLQGRYMFRRGLQEQLRLRAPQARSPVPIHAIAMSTLPTSNATATVKWKSALSLEIDVGVADLLQPSPPPTAPYVLVEQRRRSYQVSFTPAARGARVLYVSGGDLHDAGVIDPDRTARRLRAP
jgi:hypothetical protein